MVRLLVFSFFIVFGVTVIAGEAAELVVNKRVNVKGQTRILLGQVVNLKNINPEIAQELQKIDLGVAPGVGQTIKFKGSVLTRLIRKPVADLEQKWGQKMSLVVPNIVEVYRSKYVLDEEELKSAIIQKYQKTCQECEFQVSGIQMPWIADIDPEAKWTLDANSQNLSRGSFSLPIKIEPTDGPSRVYWVGGKIQIVKNVPVATRALQIGERLQAGDFQSQKREVTFADDGVIDGESLLGKKISRGLRVNDIIWRRDLVKEIAIKQGQAVQIVSESDYYDISLRGVAQEQGEVGDTIRVINPSTQTIIFAIVKEPGVVKVQ